MTDIKAIHIVFAALALIIVVFSIMTVTTRRILRAATYLLFVLFATAALYFQLDYQFLGAVQLTIYAGGIIVLYVFSILLTSGVGEKQDKPETKKVVPALLASLGGFALAGWMLFNENMNAAPLTATDPNMSEVGMALMGMGRNGYIFPFEVISVFLLACIIGGLLIARKR
ncbi:MAG: NADH-quinone oxidoreductase subunit J [Flavobacteriales bacterium]|nr:NADH-quinone oxidoreductase subunit J [Flavobacteriales bacterium]